MTLVFTTKGRDVKHNPVVICRRTAHIDSQMIRFNHAADYPDEKFAFHINEVLFDELSQRDGNGLVRAAYNHLLACDRCETRHCLIPEPCGNAEAREARENKD